MSGANISFSSLSPDAGETVTFPGASAPAAAPGAVRIPTGGPDPYADLIAGRAPGAGPTPNIQFSSLSPDAGTTVNLGGSKGVPPELQADLKTLTEFLKSQQGGGGSADVREGLIKDGAKEWAKAQDISIPKPPAGATSSQPTGGPLANMPNPTKAAIMGALGRILTAGAARLAGGVAGAVAPSTATNAQEPGDLAKKGLGTGASSVKFADWDKNTPAAKPAAAAPSKPSTPPAQAGEKPYAAPAKKPLSSFERAFAAAVKDPAKPKVFEWNGKKYRAELAQDVKRKGLKAITNDDGEADKLNAKELARVKS